MSDDIVQHAHYEQQKDGMLVMLINGFYIRQKPNGDLEVKCRPRHFVCSPSTGVVHVRTANIDMAIEVLLDDFVIFNLV